MKYPKQLMAGQASIVWMLPFSFLSHLCWKIDEQAITQILPSLQQQFNVSTIDSQWYSTAFYLASAAGAIPLGKIGERFGQPKVIAWCLTVYTLSQLATFFVKTKFWLLIILRIITGFVIVGVVANKNALLTKFPSKENSGKSISISLIINNAVIIFIPYIAGLFIDHLSYRYNMLFASIVSLLCIFTLIPYQNNPFEKRLKFDILGSCFLIVAVASFCGAFVTFARKYYITSGILIVVFCIFQPLLIYAEKYSTDPILPPFLMHQPFSTQFMAYILNYICQGGNLFVYPQVANIMGHSSTQVGIVTAISGFLLFINSFAIPEVQLKICNYILITFYNILAIISQAIQLIFFKNFIANSICFGLQNVFYMSVMVVIYKQMLTSLPQKYASRVSGFPPTARTVGNSISLCIFSSLYTIMMNFNKSDDDETQKLKSYEACTLAMLVLSLVPIMLYILFVGNNSNEKSKFGFLNILLHDMTIPKEMQDDDIIQIAQNVVQSEESLQQARLK